MDIKSQNPDHVNKNVGKAGKAGDQGLLKAISKPIFSVILNEQSWP
jgi:hypothetical protein